MNGINNFGSKNRSTTNFSPESKNYSRSFIVLSSVAWLLYVFVIVLMLRNKTLRRRSANKFLVNLFISDGIVCIVFICYAGVLLATWNDEKSFFGKNFRLPTLEIVFHIIVVSPMLNFTLITVDRLIAVKWPFFYEERIHTKQSFIAIATVWGITTAYAIALITLVCVYDAGSSRYLAKIIFIVVVIAGFITLFISNSFVFLEAMRQLRAVTKTTLCIQNISEQPSSKSTNKEKEFRKKEFRLVRMNIGQILCYFLFWANVIILTITLLVYADAVEPPIHEVYSIACWYLVLIYYLCNPLWYVAFSYHVKREVKQLFCTKRLRRKNSLFLNHI